MMTCQCHAMAVSSHKSGHLSCRKLFHAYSLKRCSFFVLLFVMLPAVFLGVATLIVMLILKPQKPVFSLQTVSLDSYKLDAYSNSTLFLSSVITLTLNATNPNKVGIWYSPSQLEAFYDGFPIGIFRIPGFFQSPRISNERVETRVLFPCVNVSQIVAEASLKNDSRKNMLRMKIEGDVGAHLWLFHMILLKIKVGLECDIDIDYKELSMNNEVSTIGGVENHIVRWKFPGELTANPLQLFVVWSERFGTKLIGYNFPTIQCC